MDKTQTESITPGGRPSSSENLPLNEAGLTDSGGGQPQPTKDNKIKSWKLTTSKGKDPSLTPSYNNVKTSNDKHWEIQTKKKPRANPDSINRKQTKLDTYWLGAPMPISNRFEELSIDVNENSQIGNNI